MQAAAHGRREIVEILLPRTNPIPYLPDWSELYVEPIANAKSEGREAFANGDYGYALYCFSRPSCIDPDDATLHANLSLCSLKLRNGVQAVRYAQECQRLRPDWAKAWFREGEALSMLQKHGAAVTAFQEALKLDPASVEIKNKLRY
ncbi:hypothetical protein BDA96_08G172600 [Sorghum bicolor]|uniref:Uncharacterized protein n=2 Tax=Sorghum bicolor TaxID=4558 RepID=A0A921QGQ0_SORBI|nr:hypothetical protein BDA96_08G172600 [Sorghum bicolor]KXG23897.1 hypothetical protein SORBI_3008G156000 [Sorghum bicolor]